MSGSILYIDQYMENPFMRRSSQGCSCKWVQESDRDCSPPLDLLLGTDH